MDNWTRRGMLAASALGAATLAARPGQQTRIRTTSRSPRPSAAQRVHRPRIHRRRGHGHGAAEHLQGLPDVRVAAVCDVYEPHARRAQSAADGKPEVYHDFRKVLDRKDIDAVVIATPDHWHAIPTILACQAGKDVYCEKPLTHRIAEGRAMVNAAEK